MWQLIDVCLALLIPIAILSNLVLAPYTKVEESFNIQATHDILTYGLPWKNEGLREHYDHFSFPGSVPRTFVGAVTLAGSSWPFIWLNERWGAAIFDRQLIVRAVLGLLNATCMIFYRMSVARSFGRSAANWYAVFQACQFHMMYYSSRTLPNFFAFGLTTFALRNLLPLAGRNPASRSSVRRKESALTILTVAGIVFRSEIAVLLACHTLYLWLSPRNYLPFRSIVKSGLSGVALGLGLTVPIDTFFWRSPLPIWPELSGFIYNFVEGKSQDWGVEPWHFYFTSAIPRLLFNPILYQICIPYALLTPVVRRPILDVLIPCLSFVTIYSCQPHKEWRFIVYVIPPLLAAASAGASWIWTRRSKKFQYRIISYAILASTLASFAASGAMLVVSRLNYPGADALNRLHSIAGNETGVLRVHMDTLTCMTGVTRFSERRPPPLADIGGPREQGQGTFWLYDKTEDEETLLDAFFWEKVDYAITERPERVPGQWIVLDTIYAFGGMRLVRIAQEDLPRPQEALEAAWGIGFDIWQHVRRMWERRAWDPTVTDDFALLATRLYDTAQGIIATRITTGWWLEMKMEPRLRILQKEHTVTQISDEVNAEDMSHSESID